MTKRLSLIVSSAALLVGVHPIFAGDYPPGYDWHASDPLLFAQVVIEGTIANVELKEVTPEQYGEPEATDTRPLIAVLQMSGTHMLRGPEFAGPLYADPIVDWHALIGSHVVLCATWTPRLERYLVAKEEEVFTRVGAEWVRMRPEEKLSDNDLKSMISDTQPQALASRSDFVVSGRIVALEDSTVITAGQRRGKVKKITLERTSNMKGNLASGNVRFLAYSWVARVPALGVGQDWVAFLEKKGPNLWLVGGANGLLRVGKNDQLLYDGVTACRLSRSQLTRLIKAEAANDK